MNFYGVHKFYFLSQMFLLSLSIFTLMADHAKGDDERFPKPIFENERFRAPWTNWTKPTTTSALWWMAFSKDKSQIPNNEELNNTLPILTPKFDETNSKNMRVTWLGHATVLVQMNDVTILTDPIFSERCSANQHLGPKRYRPVPCSIKDLPPIDLILISHNHFDHLDYNSVIQLNERFGEKTTWFVPKGLKSWMNECGVDRVYEMSWWDEQNLQSKSGIKVVSLPAQHWCRRGIFDTNKVLWASWAVIGPRYRFYFAGDTGYPDRASIFKSIGDKYGPFDLAAIPIGAYDPRWMMQEQHVDPSQAVQIHLDVRAKSSVGIHWGTFRLTNEPYLQPKTDLIAVLQKMTLNQEEFFTLKHGESKIIGD